MNTSTLQGCFPDPKPVHRRNFIRENVKQIKQMQGLLQDAGIIQPKQPPKEEKPRIMPRLSKSVNQSTEMPKSPSQNKISKQLLNKATKTKLDLTTRKKERTKVIETVEDQKFTHRSMQTERTDDLCKLYETGVIKYPSPNLVVKEKSPSPRRKALGQGDTEDNISPALQSLELEEKDYVKENMKNLMKPKATKLDSGKVPSQAPPTYQRGVIPKYLRDRKDDDVKEQPQHEPECPPGHVLLPEEERKETLRVLRQSYADRIQELNAMPVRSDTLRMRKRKVEIEEELKRIDGGIKVFQRPKVFVKVNA